MTQYNKETLVHNLEHRIAQEKQHDEAQQAKYEVEFDEWQRTVVSQFMQAVKDFDPDGEQSWNQERAFNSFGPPSKPRNGGSCSRTEEALARLNMIPANKGGNVVLGMKDSILHLGGVNCGH